MHAPGPARDPRPKPSIRSAHSSEETHGGPTAGSGGRGKGAAVGLSMVVLLTTFAFAVLMTVAMALYPGGNIWVRNEPGYDFWRNFWCDLLRHPAYNGEPNWVAPGVAQAAMFTLAVGLAVFFVIAPSLFPAKRRLGMLVTLAGLTGASGLALVSAVSNGHFPRLHGTTVLLAGPSGLLAVIGTLVGMLRRPAHFRRSAAIGLALLAAALVSLVQYAREYAFGAASSEWLPRSQKVATLLALVWMCVVSIDAARLARRRPPNEPELAEEGRDR